LGDFEGAGASAALAEEAAADVGFEAVLEFFDDLFDDAAGDGEDGFALELVAEGEEGFEEVEVGFEFAEDFVVGEEFGEFVAFEGVFFDEFDGVVGEEVADFADPVGDVGAAGEEAAAFEVALFVGGAIVVGADASAFVFLAVEEVEGLFPALVVGG